MNIITKIGTNALSSSAPLKGSDPSSPLVTATPRSHKIDIPPSFSTNAAALTGSQETSSPVYTEQQLRKQGLECLVAVLQSLVAWGVTSGKTAIENGGETVQANVHNE